MMFFATQIVNVPTMGDSISEGTVQEYVKQVGDYVEADEIVAIVETDKVSVDIRSPKAGVIQQWFAEEGDTIEVEQKFFEIDIDAKAPEGGASAAAPESTASEPAAKAAEPTKTAAAPAQTPKAAPKAAPKKAPKGGKAPTEIGSSRTETRVKMSRMRLRIADRLKEAQNTNAMLTTFNEVDMTNLMGMRKEFQEQFTAKHGIKLGFMSAFVKATVQASKQQPVVNAVIEGDEIVYRDYVDISVAVSTPTGLVVPVLRNCQDMSFADVEKELVKLAMKARDGKITLEDMTGGTFTITNGGVFGSLMGTPIINPPQSAILGMHGIKQRPICVGSEILARPMMYIALTYDHRLIDGREAVLYLRKIKDVIEDPRSILLDL